MFEKGGVPEEYYTIPEGEPVIRRTGKDLTILTIGATLYTALDAAEDLKNIYSLEAEVIDLRFMNPLRYDILLESLKRQGEYFLPPMHLREVLFFIL